MIQRESSATIKDAPKPYEQSEPAKSRPILEFDCRGLEFTDFKPEVCSIFETLHILPPYLNLVQGEWLAEGIDSGSKFTAIDLSEGEWFDYDEKANEEVSITELKWTIKRS